MTNMGQSATGTPGRRYLAIVQDERGYPPLGQMDPAPPDGPAPATVLSVVKADEYDVLHEALTTIYARLASSTSPKKDATECAEIAKKALGWEER